MTQDDIHTFTRATPFRPVRVTLTRGEEFDIRHPDMLMALDTLADILRPSRPGERSTVTHVGLDHVLKIEYLTPDAAPPLNRSTV